MTACIVPFEAWHADAVLPRLCAVHQERAEQVAPVRDVLAAALPASALVRTGLLHGAPECIMGMVLSPVAGHPWLLRTDEATRQFRPLVRHCHAFIAECLAVRPVLRADVPPDDETLRHWLRWLGFRLLGTEGGLARWERTV